jgi:hypothetical protein
MSVAGLRPGRNVPLGQPRSLAEKEFLHALFKKLLRAGIERVQSVLVEQHLRIFDPHPPGFA